MASFSVEVDPLKIRHVTLGRFRIMRTETELDRVDAEGRILEKIIALLNSDAELSALIKNSIWEDGPKGWTVVDA